MLPAFEYDTYEQLQKQFPPIGSQVDTADGRGRVLGHEIIAGQLLVETGDRVRKLVDWSTVTPVLADNGPKKPPRTDTVDDVSKKPNVSEKPAVTKTADNSKS